MSSTNTIVLRPRFKFELNQDYETALKAFENSTQDSFIVSRVDHHVFIKFPREEQQFWTPQLHLEIDEVDANNSLVRGLFGPNPTVWTLFILLWLVYLLLWQYGHTLIML